MKFNLTSLDLKLVYISSVLIILMPFFLVTGPFLSDFFFSYNDIISLLFNN